MDNGQLDNLSFFQLFCKYGGIKRLFNTVESYVGLLASYIAVILLLFLQEEGLITLLNSYGVLLTSISAGIFGIVVSALAIITSLSNTKLVKVLIKHDIFYNLLFPFYFSAVSWGVNIIINFLIFILSYIDWNSIGDTGKFILVLLFIISFTCFFWVLLNTITLVGITLRYISYGNQLLDIIEYVEED
ncbi:hypothetical protein [Thermotalea metallivorans]|uniref:Uncharacterized protein n=1 Tax=Thermotalea metallivorans TaxID=520762 RepID=A0A140LA07_9FIRM|nr:hypothetical protein [Thermotalea metallivorans]KXG77382.1 hypothetical protein AN619_05080 [Thermotalea metallivorans]